MAGAGGATSGSEAPETAAAGTGLPAVTPAKPKSGR